MNRQRLFAVVLVLAGAGLALLAATRDWVTQRVSAVPGVISLTASGEQAAPAVAALAVAAGAGAVVLLLAGRLVARLAGIMIVLFGAGMIASVISVLADPRAAAAPAVPAATGRAGPLPDPATASAWVWVALAGALVVVAGGGLAAVRGGAWSMPGRRFEPDAAPGGADPAAEDHVAAWDALSRGEDPTR